MKLKQIILLALLLASVVAIIFVATRDNSEQQSGKLTVAASFYPLYDFAKQVGGNKVHAINMTPANAEPHSFEPSAKDLASAQRSQVFIYNGSDFEPWAAKFVGSYKHTIVAASKNVELHEVHEEESHDEHHEEHAHEEGTLDPHFWLDPVLAQQMVLNIRDGFIKQQPQNKEYFTKQADAYIAQLKELDASYKSGLAHCEQDTVVTSHSAFNYLAERYGFHVASITGLNPETEPSAAKLAELTTVIREKKIKYVLFETLVSPRIADTIAQETGAKTAVFNPIEGLTTDEQKEGKNYISVQRENLATLRAALTCK